MKLCIEKSSNYASKKYPYYEIEITFMIGDADGYIEKNVEFDASEAETMLPLILALECCTKAYPSGRGGYDTYDDLFWRDLFFGDLPFICKDEGEDYIETIERYVDMFETTEVLEDPVTKEISNEEYSKLYELCYNELVSLSNLLNPKRIKIDHPWQPDGYGIQCSFDRYEIFYFDESGVKHDVSVKFSNIEKTLIDQSSRWPINSVNPFSETMKLYLESLKKV